MGMVPDVTVSPAVFDTDILNGAPGSCIGTAAKGKAMKQDTTEAGPVRLLLVDDQKLFREAISPALIREGFAIAGEAGTGEDAVSLAQRIHPDIVLMDVRMPGMGGVRATAALLKVSPKSRVVGLSMSSDRDTVLQMMQAGACAFVAKGEQDDLIAVLRRLGTECLLSPDRRDGQGGLAAARTGSPERVRSSRTSVSKTRRGSNASSRGGALPRCFRKEVPRTTVSGS